MEKGGEVVVTEKSRDSPPLKAHTTRSMTDWIYQKKKGKKKHILPLPPPCKSDPEIGLC